MRTKGLCEVLSTALAIGESRTGMAIEREGMNMTLIVSFPDTEQTTLASTTCCGR